MIIITFSIITLIKMRGTEEDLLEMEEVMDHSELEEGVMEEEIAPLMDSFPQVKLEDLEVIVQDIMVHSLLTME